MKLRSSWFPWLALVLAARPAAGQTAPSVGTLTVLSRPSGAVFRLSGEQVVVGRTPMVIDRGLTGRYEVRSLDRGYATWKRTVFLSGTMADTVWMTLHPRGPAGAGLRSLLIPGWGQFYSGRGGRGALFLGGTVAAGAAFAFTALRYQDKLDAYRDADARYQVASTVSDVANAFEARRRASDAAETAYKNRQIAFGVFCGVWGLNLLEAMVKFPSPPSDRVSLSVAPPDPVSRSAAMATLTVRF